MLLLLLQLLLLLLLFPQLLRLPLVAKTCGILSMPVIDFADCVHDGCEIFNANVASFRTILHCCLSMPVIDFANGVNDGCEIFNPNVESYRLLVVLLPLHVHLGDFSFSVTSSSACLPCCTTCTRISEISDFSVTSS